jgi:ubiquinone/menaquinone biosynthesis C-methylase UbiE
VQRDAARVRAEYERRAVDPRLRRYYARVGPAFERQRAERFAIIAEAIGELGSRPSLRVLDVGCGSGAYLEDLSRQGFLPRNLSGVDLLAKEVGEAQSRLPDSHITVGNAARLPFPDAAFDAALLVTVLSSIIDADVRVRAAKEAARVVRRGGLIVTYDVRVVRDRNPHLVPIGEDELDRLFAGHGSISMTRHGLSLAVASRVPAPIAKFLSRIPILLDGIFAVTRVSGESLRP